jgi:hypothetical protein
MIRFRFALSSALRWLAAWADPYPGFHMAAQPAPITLVTHDADGTRVLVSVPAERVQYVVTASFPTHEDFERDASRRQEVFGV